IDQLALVKYLRFDRQHVQPSLSSERHLSCTHFNPVVQGQRLQRSALVGKRDQPARRRSGLQRNTKQRQELAPVSFRNLVAAIQQVLGEEREDLDDRDTRIALVEVRPLGIVHGDARQHLVQQFLVTSIVKRGYL